ncbi:sugar transferase [Patescibacteria group bacterium]
MKLIYRLFILVLVLVSLPIMVVIAAISIIASGFLVFFKQERTGKNEKSFTMYKFRTMVNNAEKIKARYKKMDEANGPVFKIRNDPRFTSFGKFLSHTGLDELPQLVNVLKGDMGLIGPRPLPVDEAKKLKSWQRKRHSIKPGIISPWILNGYHSQSFDDWIKSDIEYIKNKTVWTDVKLSIKAILFLVELFVSELRDFL